MRSVVPLLLIAFLALPAIAAEDGTGTLRRVHEALVEYQQLMGAPPADVEELLLLTSLERADLYLDGSAGAKLFRTRPAWATPDVYFSLGKWDDPFAEGSPIIASCVAWENNEEWHLHVDGQIEKAQLDIGDYVPFTMEIGGLGRTEVKPEKIARPSARLGLSLVNRGTEDHARKAVFVDAMIPGYARSFPDGPQDFRPGDRLIQVGGYQIETVERLDEFLRGSPGLQFDMLIQREEHGPPIRRRSLSTIWEDLSPDDPVAVAARAAATLAENGHGFLGVGTEDGTPGARISFLQDEGPATRAGLHVGEEILAVDGRPIMDKQDLMRRIGSLPAGRTVRLTVQGGKGGSRTEEIVLGRAQDYKLAYDRFSIHYAQINLYEGLQQAGGVMPSQVVDLFESHYGSRRTAVEWLQKALADPKFSHLRYELHLYLAECLAIDFQPKPARPHLVRARELAPITATPGAWARAAGFIYLREKNFDQAAAALVEATGKRDALLLARRLAASQDSGDLATFERALANPNLPARIPVTAPPASDQIPASGGK